MADVVIDPTFDDSQDDDSNYGSDINSYTTSLASKATDYKFIHGRRYHSYEEGRYVFPNDEDESERLDIMHQAVKAALGGKLFTAPVHDPKRVLDIGTGTGIWAIEIGEMFANADVVGNDLSPIQPRWVPPNVHFEVDEVEKPWTFSKPFDFIHCRAMYGAIHDWPNLVASAFEHTAPGGYVEFTDWDSWLDSPDNTIEGSSFKMVNNLLVNSLEKAGTTASPGPKLEGWLRDAGFEIIESTVKPLPFGLWPKNKQLKEVGAWNYMQVTEGIESFCMYILHVIEGWSKQEVDIICAKVRKELNDKKYHSMLKVHNVVGRKPAPPVAEEES